MSHQELLNQIVVTENISVLSGVREAVMRQVFGGQERICKKIGGVLFQLTLPALDDFAGCVHMRCMGIDNGMVEVEVRVRLITRQLGNQMTSLGFDATPTLTTHVSSEDVRLRTLNDITELRCDLD